MNVTIAKERQEKENLLPEQLSKAIARICKIESTPLLEKSISLIIEALENGKIGLSMKSNLSEISEATVKSWKTILINDGVAAIPPGYAPIIIDNDTLYLARYYFYHNQLQKQLERLAKEVVPIVDEKNITDILSRLFPETNVKPNWQKVAAALALKKNFCVISGGPGTGKTTTVLRLLATLCEVSKNKLRIRLAAPTGKAAIRMQESIRVNLSGINCSNEIKDQLMVEACTLHRLLGYKKNSVNFRHNAGYPLALDVLVVDESSMVDSAMMAKLLDAIPKGAKVVLLGDKDQLDAVEPGNPFAEICSRFGFSKEFARELETLSEVELEKSVSSKPELLSDNLIFLRHSYRFGSDSGIGELSRAINESQYTRALDLMNNPEYSDIKWCKYKPSEFRHYNASEIDPLIKKVCDGFEHYIDAIKREPDLNKTFSAYYSFCILVAVRRGYSGVEDINQLVQAALKFPMDKKWFHGRPVMVTQNDYQTGLFNGDVGICLDLDGCGPRIYFPATDGFRDFSPSRVPQHETAFAMTVHKSQGSEFGEVLFILPESESRVMNKSLIYTAITRAKDKVELWGIEDVFLKF